MQPWLEVKNRFFECGLLLQGSCDLRCLSTPPAGVICVVLLLIICLMATLLWLMTRQKGSYNTNEMEDMEDDDDEDSDGSDPALQMKEPLTIREEEE